MKAPNGKPTNLNERQWLQVRTKAFKDWFGDWENNPSQASKVVDENGEPLVVYHGSYYKNDATIIGDWSKNALPYATYFAPYQGYANFKHVYSAFLNIKNPIYSDELLTEEAIQDEAIFKKFIIDSGYDGAISGIQRELYKIPSNATKAREIVVVNPNQIKSATSNTGEFSTTNDDIRYSSVTERPIKVPSVTSFAERLQVQQQPKFASLVARGEISTSCR